MRQQQYQKQSQHSDTHRGFALPLTMGMGLIMIVVSMAVVVRTQSDTVAAAAKNGKSESLSAAEIGVSRYQGLLAKYRLLARKENEQWVAAAPDLTNIATCLGVTNVSSELSTFAATGWQNVDANDVNKGQYRLIDYTYGSGQGSLEIEGRADQGSATPLTRLTVKIPVAPPSASSVVPGLWINNASVSDMAKDKVNGDIVINACTLPTGSGQPTSANLYDPSTQKIQAAKQGFPAQPSSSTAKSISTTDLWSKTLPLNLSDPKDAKGRYLYKVSDLKASGNKEIRVTSGVKVDIFVDGDIELSGNPDINKNGQPNQVRIFGGPGTAKAHFNGTGTINAFVFAPNATGSVNGGGNTNGNFRGSLWIKDWDASSNNSKVKVDAVGSFADYDFPTNPIARDSLAAISTWEQTQSVGAP